MGSQPKQRVTPLLPKGHQAKGDNGDPRDPVDPSQAGRGEVVAEAGRTAAEAEPPGGRTQENTANQG